MQIRHQANETFYVLMSSYILNLCVQKVLSTPGESVHLPFVLKVYGLKHLWYKHIHGQWHMKMSTVLQNVIMACSLHRRHHRPTVSLQEFLFVTSCSCLSLSVKKVWSNFCSGHVVGFFCWLPVDIIFPLIMILLDKKPAWTQVCKRVMC